MLPRVVEPVLLAAAFALSTGCASTLPSVTSAALSAPPAPLVATARPVGACEGDFLTGKDPFETGCASDGETVTRALARDGSARAIGLVELRWSPRCRTSWARVVRFDGKKEALLDGAVSADGASEQSFHAKGGVALWTDMVFADGACATASATLYGDGDLALADAQATRCGKTARSHENTTAQR